MVITHLSLTNFRNYTRLELDLPQGIILLQGDNAQGKTNLLEAIYYLATSRSPQTNSDVEVINWLARRDAMAFARLMVDVKWDGKTHRIELVLTPANNSSSLSGGFRKQIRINGVAKRAMDLIGLFNVVIFRPQDIDIVAGTPAARRRYLDAMLCQIDNHYCRALQSYNRVLTQRNCLLRTLRERNGDVSQLEFWDDRLVEHGAYVIARRGLAIVALNHFAQAIHHDITDGLEHLVLAYQPSFSTLTETQRAAAVAWDDLETTKTSLSPTFGASLKQSRREEIARGVTLVGPHRDDFRFLLPDIDLTIYGSRGQQRTAALSLKLAEAEVVRQVKGYWPILLLDDIMSELDGARRRRVLELINSAAQTLITATDVDVYSVQFLSQVLRYRVREGQIERLEG